MRKPVQIAAAVLGPRNITRITALRDYSPAAVESLARTVAKKEPGRTYYLVSVDSKGKNVLMTWHVGEGFTHAEGWWIHADD